MADKTIGDLPVAGALYEDSLLVVEQQSEARSIRGKLVADFARESAAADVQRAVDAADKAEKAAAGAAAEVSQRLAGYVDDAKGSADAAKQAEAGAAESLAKLDGQVERAEDARAGAEEARDAIEGMTVSADTLPPGSAATAVKTTTDGSFNIHLGIPAGERGDTGPEGPVGPEGPQGPQGDTGRGFTILGRYDSREALEAAVQDPAVGDAYQVGAEAPYDVYIYDAQEGWVNSGPINVDLPAHLIVGEDSELGTVLPVDADTLEGHNAAYFVSKTAMNTELGKKQDMLPYYTNKNLLDNPDFRDPVNQRGQTEYTGMGYHIDRWMSLSNTMSIKIEPGKYITISDQAPSIEPFLQKLDSEVVDSIRGKYVTYSVLTDTGLYSNTVLLPESGSTNDLHIALPNNFHAGLYYDSQGLRFRMYGTGSINIIAVKLELGSTQTLAHKEGDAWVLNEVPDYAEELAKCQRYRIVETSANNSIYGRTEGADTNLTLVIPTPNTMRANAVVSIPKLVVCGMGQAFTVNNLSTLFTAKNNILSAYIENLIPTGIGPFQPVVCYAQNGYVVSADL